jgi:hypothetical protein
MTNIKYYLVSYDRCDKRAVSNLSEEEKKRVVCYAVNGSVPKKIDAGIEVVNEWELKWHSNRYQSLKYYEYGLLPHCVKNPDLLEGLTHIGFLHNDVLFAKNSINEMVEDLNSNPNQIYYIVLRQKNVLFFTKDQLKYVAE